MLQNHALRHCKQRDVGSVWIKDKKRMKNGNYRREMKAVWRTCIIKTFRIISKMAARRWKIISQWLLVSLFLCFWINLNFALFQSCFPLRDQDQDQDCLLVKRRNDNHSPGPVIRELVPSSHQRSELSNTILCIFSGWDQRIGEGIPIPDSLGKEATFINICIGNGSLKCHRVLIPKTPNFGDKVICWYTGFTFKTFI